MSRKQTGEPLKKEEQFPLRSELAVLIWIARFARPDASYEASTSAKISETRNETITNQRDIEEIVGVNPTKANGDITLIAFNVLVSLRRRARQI